MPERSFLIGKSFSGLVILLILATTISCNKESDPGKNEVFIEEMAFNPVVLSVPVNTTVTWKNRDDVKHTVTSGTRAFNSGEIGLNGTFSTTFTKPGTYPYYCSIHSEMTGNIVVQDNVSK